MLTHNAVKALCKTENLGFSPLILFFMDEVCRKKTQVSPSFRKIRYRTETLCVEKKMGASNTTVARAQKKGKPMKLIIFLHPGAGSEDALRTMIIG